MERRPELAVTDVNVGASFQQHRHHVTVVVDAALGGRKHWRWLQGAAVSGNLPPTEAPQDLPGMEPGQIRTPRRYGAGAGIPACPQPSWREAIPRWGLHQAGTGTHRGSLPSGFSHVGQCQRGATLNPGHQNSRCAPARHNHALAGVAPRGRTRHPPARIPVPPPHPAPGAVTAQHPAPPTTLGSGHAGTQHPRAEPVNGMERTEGEKPELP